MPHRLLLVLFFAAMLGACRGADAVSEAPEAPPEIRGVWLTNIDSDLLFSREAVADGMARLAERGFNVVFPVVWNDGYTLYPSDVMAETFGEAYRIDSAFVADGRDPLAEVVEEAHRHGMAVVPWFEFGFSSSYNPPDDLLAMKPEWAARDRDGGVLTKNGFRWMNGLHPEVQDFVLALVREVAEGYEVDGIQGDDRLPAMPSEGGYDAFTVGLYASEHGGAAPPDDPKDPAWLQWRADKLSDFGGRLYRMVKDVDPGLVVSLSPSVYPWSLQEYLQDWPTWIARGQVDWLHPQAYRYDLDGYRATLDQVVQAADSARAASGHQVVLAPGILVKAGPRYNGPAYVHGALRANRAHGLDGEVFFFYEGLWDQNAHLADSLHAHFYQTPAPLPR